MLRETAGDCATKDFLSQPKKVLVTLIHFICSFFSTARRTNQEAPPLLSGFWVRRYGRRRGLRNSLRSDSPRPFSSVFLATSPPDKGGIGGSCLYSNPFALWALPLYSFQEHPAMLRDTAGRGLCYKGLSFPAKESPCYTNSLYLFILLNSEKNEPRSAAAVIGLLGSSLRSPSGSAELASLGQSSPFFLRLPCDFTAR